jgi:large subunit ribosomal protein L21
MSPLFEGFYLMSAYAVIETGGKQYKVSEGDVLQVEKLEAEAGSTVTFDSVLAVSGGEGLSLESKSPVQAEVLEHIRGPKLLAFKKKRRKGYKRRVGHRQGYTKVKITGLS